MKTNSRFEAVAARVVPGARLSRSARQILLGGLAIISCAQAFGQSVISGWGYNNNRNAANTAEVQLTTTNVNVTNFGKLGAYTAAGQVLAQPLYMPNIAVPGVGTKNVLYVADMMNNLYAFDADAPGSAPLWTRNYGANAVVTYVYNGATTGTGNLGILGTPVIDTATQRIFFVTTTGPITIVNGTNQPISTSSATLTLHAVNYVTGADVGSVVLSGTYNGFSISGCVLQNRAGLAVSGTNVYVTLGSVSPGDETPYAGWMLSYDTNTLAQTGVFSPSSSVLNGVGIWSSGGAPAVDSIGNVYAPTGNGINGSAWDGKSNFNESVLQFSKNAGVLGSYWTASNWQALDNLDDDVATGAVAIVPGSNILLAGSKNGDVYVLNTSQLGGLGGGSMFHVGAVIAPVGNDPNRVLEFPMWPVGPSGSPIVYVWPGSDYVHAYSVNTATATFTQIGAAGTVLGTGEPGDPMALSANGSTTGTGILWASRGALYAFNAENLTQNLWNSTQNNARDGVAGNTYVPPVVANGRVYLAANTNQVVVYGLFQRPPTVSISSPAGSTSVPSGTAINLSVAATDPNAGASIKSVSYYDGTKLIATVSASPFSYTWTNPAVGAHSLTASALDSLGLTGTSAAVSVTVAGSPLAVTLTAPTNGTSVAAGTTIPLTATATDPNAGAVIKSVAFYDGTQLLATVTAAPYSFNWTGASAGTHTVDAVATDSLGITGTSASSTVTVTGTAPTVSLSSPSNGAVFASGSPIGLTATVTDPNAAATIKSVSFLDGANVIATVTAAPFTYSWTTAAAGSHSITATATDSYGLTGTSASSSVTVSAPTVTTIPGALAVWNFDGATGTTVADTTGAGHTLTLGGGVSLTPTGLSGAGLLSTFPNGVGATTPSLVNTAASFSVSLWARVDALTTCNGGTLASQDGTTVSGFYLSITPSACPNASTFNFSMMASDTDAAASTAVTGGGSVVLGAWNHVVAVRDATAKTLTLYVNGNLVGTTAYTAAWSATGPFALGRGKFSGNPTGPLAGALDAVAVFQRVLTAAEVSALYKAGGNTSIVTAPTPAPSALTVALAQPNPAVSMMNGTVVSFSSTVTDPNAGATVSSVVYKDGANTLATTTAAPYSYSWTAATGAHSITAMASDSKAASGTSAAYAVNVVASNGTPPTGAVSCAAQNATCTLPAGTTTTVWFGSGSNWNTLANASGSVACSTAVFGDPLTTATKSCVYTPVVTPPATVPAGAVAAWKFDGATGTTVADTTGAGHTLTLGGGVSLTPTGLSGAGLLSTFPNGVGATTPSLVNTAASFSVSLWARVDALTTCNGGTLASQDGTTVSGFYLSITPSACPNASTFNFSMLSSDTDAAASSAVTGGGSVVLGAWNHVVAVRDATAKTLTLYVNGTLVGTTAYTSAWSATGPFALGRGKFSGNPTGPLAGALDSVYVYPRVLTAAEVTQLYQAK